MKTYPKPSKENLLTRYRAIKTEEGVRVIVDRGDGYATTKDIKDLKELRI